MVAELPTLVLFGAQRHTAPNYSVFRKTLKINLSVEDGSYNQMGSWATAILERPEEPLLMVRNGMCRAILFSKSWGGNLKIKNFCTAGQQKRMDTRTTGGPVLKR